MENKKKTLFDLRVIAIAGISLLSVACDTGSDDSSNNEATPPLISGTTDTSSTPTQPNQSESGGDDFSINRQEEQIGSLIESHPQQQRAQLNFNPILAKVARARAEDMAARAYFSHTNPDGIGPNRLAEQAGYSLPSFYSQDAAANNIESIAGGTATRESTLEMWFNSPPHRTHVLGESEFARDQIDYGIGYAFNPNSPFRHYWVFLAARN